jgi:hypothetical protein
MLLCEAEMNIGEDDRRMFQHPYPLSKNHIAVLVSGLAFAACTAPVSSTPFFPTATSIIEPVSTSAVTTTFTSISSDTPTITPTSIPKLTGELIDQFLEEKLETNGGCELPCWWGDVIVPGKTTLEEAEWVFYSEGIPYLVPNGVVDVVFQVPHTATMQSWDYNTRITIAGQDGGIVQSIKVVGDTYSGEPTLRFARAWGEHYAWDRVLARLGMPSQVLVFIYPATYAAPASYNFTLVYESVGMLINYAGAAQEMGGSKIRACPRFDQVTRIALRLVPSGEGASLLGSQSHAFTLEETTGMSLQTFYEAFGSPNGAACLEQDVEQ